MADSNVHAFHRPLTAQQAVLAELRRAMLAGELTPGSQIVQEAIAERLGVSRVPIREALRILEGEGQVIYVPHHGYSVAELNLDELLEIQRIRELLEPEVTRKTLRQLGDEDLVRMREYFEKMEEASVSGDIAAMNTFHLQFHFTLFEGADMPRLIRILRQLWRASDPYRALYHGDDSARAASQADHLAILRLSTARDTDQLLEVLWTHREHTIERLRGPLSSRRTIAN